MYDSQAVANGTGSIPGAEYPFPVHHGGGVAVQNPVYPPYGGVHGSAVHSAYPNPLPPASAAPIAVPQHVQQHVQQQQQQPVHVPNWDPVHPQVIGGTMPRVIPRGNSASAAAAAAAQPSLSVAIPSPFGPPGSSSGHKPLPAHSAVPSPTSSTHCLNNPNMHSVHSMSNHQSYLNDSDTADGRNAFPLTFHNQFNHNHLDSDHSPFGGLHGLKGPDSWSVANTFNGFGFSDDNLSNVGSSPRPNRCPMMKLLNLGGADMPNMTCPMRGLFHNSPTGGPRPATSTVNVNVPHHPLSAMVPTDNAGTVPPALPSGSGSAGSGSALNGQHPFAYPTAAALPAPARSTTSSQNTGSGMFL